MVKEYVNKFSEVIVTFKMKWDYTDSINELIEEGEILTEEDIKSQLLQWVSDDLNHYSQWVNDNDFEMELTPEINP